jgi:hypothetical protein|tara:strand:- start:1328 stop:1759 length:432 start_codon:yes stop_codon:yes gene_type:complete
MIFQRSKTVTIEAAGHTWKFNRPPGSVVLGWAPRVAELSQGSDDASRVFPITVDSYVGMLEEIAEHVRDIDGEAADGVTAEQLDSGMNAGEGLQVWIAFFTALNATAADVGKPEKRSESDSPKTPPDDRSTTADPAGASAHAH